jgi:DNA-binding MarR family transcriptional regulator
MGEIRDKYNIRTMEERISDGINILRAISKGEKWIVSDLMKRMPGVKRSTLQNDITILVNKGFLSWDSSPFKHVYAITESGKEYLRHTHLAIERREFGLEIIRVLSVSNCPMTASGILASVKDKRGYDEDSLSLLLQDMEKNGELQEYGCISDGIPSTWSVTEEGLKILFDNEKDAPAVSCPSCHPVKETPAPKPVAAKKHDAFGLCPECKEFVLDRLFKLYIRFGKDRENAHGLLNDIANGFGLKVKVGLVEE